MESGELGKKFGELAENVALICPLFIALGVLGYTSMRRIKKNLMSNNYYKSRKSSEVGPEIEAKAKKGKGNSKLN